MGSNLRRAVAVLAGLLSSAACATATSGAPAAAAPAPSPVEWVELRVPANTWVSDLPVMNARGDIAGAIVDPDDTVAFQWWMTPLLWTRDSRDPVPMGPPLPLWDEAFAPTDVNDDGVVTLGSGISDGYLWRAGDRTDLTNPAWIAYPRAVNDRGQVAGELFTPHDPEAPDQPVRAFRWQRGRFTELPTPTGWNSSAVDITNGGEVLGRLWSGENVRAVVWRHDTMIDLGGWRTTPVDINDRGQVIGETAASEGAPSHPFLWHDGVMTDLLAGSGSDTGWVGAINNAGQVVGSIDLQPVVWRAGRPTRIEVPGGQGTATAINERGDVAGVTRGTLPEGVGGDVFAWRNGRTTVLGRPANTYVDSDPSVVGVDDRGHVAIRYQRDDGWAVLARTARRA